MTKWSTSKIFILVALTFGMLFIYLTPPFQVPDEDAHFKKSFVMAKGEFFPSIRNGVSGFEIPEELVEYIEESKSVMGNRDQKVLYSDLVLQERLPKDYSNTVFQNFSTVGTNPIGHIIPAIGIIFGKIIATITKGGMASANYLLYFARMFNLLFYIGIVALSIKITPRFKKTMLLAGLLPMSLFLAASTSYDVLMISITFLSTSIILQFINPDNASKMNYKYIFLLAILAFVLIAIKPIYASIYLLLFLTPRSKFENNKDFWLKVLSFIGIIATMYIIFRIPSYINSDSLNITNSSAITEQSKYIASNPLAFFDAFIKSIREQLDFLVPTTVGVFGLIDTYMASAFVYIHLFVLILTGIFEASEVNFKTNLLVNGVAFASVLIGILGMYFIMYLTWTPMIEGFGVGADSITGVQGRYFIPYIPIVFLCLHNGMLLKYKPIKAIKDYVLDYSCFFAFAILIVSALTMILRYYIG